MLPLLGADELASVVSFLPIHSIIMLQRTCRALSQAVHVPEEKWQKAADQLNAQFPSARWYVVLQKKLLSG